MTDAKHAALRRSRLTSFRITWKSNYAKAIFANLFEKHALTNTVSKVQPRLDSAEACIPQ